MTVNTAFCRRGPQQCLQSMAPMRELTAHMHGPSAQAGPELNHCASKHSTQTPSRNPTHLYTHFKINMHTGRAPAEPGEAPLKFCGWTLPTPHRLQLGNFQHVQLLRASYLPCGSSCHTNTILRSTAQVLFFQRHAQTSELCSEDKKASLCCKLTGNPSIQDLALTPNVTKDSFSPWQQKTNTVCPPTLFVYLFLRQDFMYCKLVSNSSYSLECPKS